MKAGALLWFYRQCQRKGVGPVLQRIRKSGPPLIAPVTADVSRSDAQSCIWFHAASVGELEALWPVILESAVRGHLLILTLFSRSAWSSLQRLVAALGAVSSPSLVLYAGYSPWEGSWEKFFISFEEARRPSLFVTYKYEAWPDLWATLTLHRVPLVILGARDRISLRVAKTVCQMCTGAIPDLTLLPFLSEEEAGLRQRFPAARIERVIDPRWERVLSRVVQSSSRVQELKSQCLDLLPSPVRVGVLGSAWPADLKFLAPILCALQPEDFLWIVPHSLDEEIIQEMVLDLQKRGVRVGRTTQLSLPRALPLQCWIVDEMGFLAELYATADWAYVGGGWGAGVHSTIEPAVHGIPVAIGPRHATQFAEVLELQALGQLTLFAPGPQGQRELVLWWNGIAHQQKQNGTQKIAWKNFAASHQGATQNILRVIEPIGGRI